MRPVDQPPAVDLRQSEAPEQAISPSKRTCYYYWLIEPVPEHFEDTADSIPALEIPIKKGRETYRLALFTDKDGQAVYARLKIPSLR